MNQEPEGGSATAPSRPWLSERGRHRRSLLVVAAVLTLVACTGDDDGTAGVVSEPTVDGTAGGEDAPPARDPTTTSSAGDTSTPGGDLEPQTIVPDAAEPTAERDSTTGLEPLLIGTEDVPAELAVSARGETARSVEFCGISFPSDVEPVDYTSVSFSHTRTALFLSEYVARFDSDAAGEALDRLRAAFDGCTEWTQETPNGEPVVYRIEPLELSSPADDTFGFTATTTLETLGTVETHSAIVRHRDFLVWVSYAGVSDEGVPVDELERYVDIAVRKLDS